MARGFLKGGIRAAPEGFDVFFPVASYQFTAGKRKLKPYILFFDNVGVMIVMSINPR